MDEKIEKKYFKLIRFSDTICNNIITSKLESKLKKMKVKPSETELQELNSFYSIFQEKFYGIALDFDGTMISLKNRNEITSKDILEPLINLNKKKIPIFILTGRGSSILKQVPLNDFKFKNYVLYAQYNGGRIILGNGKLLSEIHIRENKKYHKIKLFLEENHLNFKEKLSSFIIYENKEAFFTINSYLKKLKGWRVVKTNYSMDILPDEVSKHNALLIACKLFGLNNIDSILKIGDSGDINGNDYDFMKLNNSFSVGEFSNDFNTNFPLLDNNNVSIRGPIGLKFIFNHIDVLKK